MELSNGKIAPSDANGNVEKKSQNGKDSSIKLFSSSYLWKSHRDSQNLIMMMIVIFRRENRLESSLHSISSCIPGSHREHDCRNQWDGIHDNRKSYLSGKLTRISWLDWPVNDDSILWCGDIDLQRRSCCVLPRFRYLGSQNTECQVDLQWN